MSHIADGNREKILRLSENSPAEKSAAVRAVLQLSGGDADAARTVLQALGLTDVAQEMQQERINAR